MLIKPAEAEQEETWSFKSYSEMSAFVARLRKLLQLL